MFYWSYKNINVVLTDSEENDILRVLGTTPEQRIDYRIEGATRKRLEKQINYYLDQLYEHSREEFRKYYLRSFIGDEAINFFPILLDAYGRFSKIATIGKFKTKDDIECPNLSKIQNMTDNLKYEKQELFYVSLLNYNRILKRSQGGAPHC